jgi:putative inorganic carbon (HCO3(-)) transporter
MLASPPQTTPTHYAVGGVVCAAAGVALLGLFPGARLVGLLLAVLAAVLFWISRRAAGLTQRRAIWLRTPLDWPILLILLQVGISLWASALPDKSWVAISQLAAGLVAYYAIVNWSTDRSRLWWAVAAVIAAGLGLALIAPFGVDWFRERKTFLPAVLFEYFPLLLPDSIHPNVMAGSLATLMPLSLALSLALPSAPRRKLGLRITLLVVYLMGAAILILTKSRGGYIALGVGLWLTLWLSGRRRWAIGLALASALVVAGLLILAPADGAEELEPAQAALDASTWAFRQQVWRAGLQLVGDFPLTGVGIGTFNDVAATLYGFYAPDNPGAHNLFLQAAVDLGILGLVSYLAILLLALWAAFRAYRRFDTRDDGLLRAVAIGGFAGMMATIAHGLVDSHTWGSKGAFIPWAVIGLLVALYSLALSQRQGSKASQEAASS